MQHLTRVHKALLNHWAKHAAHRAIVRLTQIHDTATDLPSQDAVLTSVAAEITSALQAHVDRRQAAGQFTNHYPSANILRELMEDPKVVAASLRKCVGALVRRSQPLRIRLLHSTLSPKL